MWRFWFFLMCESRSVETGGSGGCRAEMVWCYDFMMISPCSHTSNNLMHATHLPSDMLARSDDVWQCYRTSLNRKYILWVLYQTLSNTAYMSCLPHRARARRKPDNNFISSTFQMNVVGCVLLEWGIWSRLWEISCSWCLSCFLQSR